LQYFTYDVSPARVLFGAGRLADVGTELERLGAKCALIITTPEQQAQGHALARQIGSLAGAVFDGATMHTPTEVTAAALAIVQARRCDALVAVGGGSAIGLSKALTLRARLPQIAIPTTYAGSEVTPILGETAAGPQIAIPTTYAGSEVTPILGETAAGVKKTRRSPLLLPQVVIYDVELTLSLPPLMSAGSGLNAIAHAAEALYARDANPIISLMAEEGITALARSLPAVVRQPGDLDARADAQYGAWLCGVCLGTVGMALHHKLCHVLGGTFDLPHAQTHAVVLSHAIAYNARAAPGAISRLRRALGGGQEPWLQLHDMVRQLGLPTSLKALGMPKGGLERALELVLTDGYWNPRPMEAEPLRQLLRRAFDGSAPHND